METVEIPLQLAMKAARMFRPLKPYVNKKIQEVNRLTKEKAGEQIIVDTPVEEVKKRKKVKE